MNKITFDELRQGMQSFLDFPSAEDRVQLTIEQMTADILLSKAENGNRPPLDVLTDYLGNGDTKQRLKMIIGMSGGSVEKLQRVFESIYPNTPLMGVLKDKTMRQRMAAFILHPDDEQVFIPAFIRKSFTLPQNWIDLLRDKEHMLAIARNTQAAFYSVQMGLGLEGEIVKVVKRCGLDFEKGKVDLVDSKEVDVAIPDRNSPKVLVMSSYALTTSSAQTNRANEQAAMYEYITRMRRSRKGRGKDSCLFVNVIDGGGWLKRHRDLEQLWTNCDYCFPCSRLNDFRELLGSL